MEKECFLRACGMASAPVSVEHIDPIGMIHTLRILRIHSQQESCTRGPSEQQLLLSSEWCAMFEAFQVKVFGEDGTGLCDMEMWRNVWVGMKVDSDSLTEASEQQRDKKSLHHGKVAGHCVQSPAFRVEVIVCGCLSLWHYYYFTFPLLACYTVVNTQAVASAQCQLLGVLGGLVLEVETLAKDYRD